MNETALMPRAWLRRLDFALSAPPLPSLDELLCASCSDDLDMTYSAALTWCGRCRLVYTQGGSRLLCMVPEQWHPHPLFDFWERAFDGAQEIESDLAFARHLSEAASGAPTKPVITDLIRKPDQIRIGRLALAHGLLTRSEVAWVLQFQRAARAHRRRCFGEIATELGLWDRTIAARLLAAQAERRRGLAVAVAERLELCAQQYLAAERSFFGLAPAPSALGRAAPFDSLMVE